MKKLIGIILIVMFVAGISFARKKKPTEIEKLQAQYQVLAQKKQQLINIANKQISAVDLAMIRIEGAILYLQEKASKKKNKKKRTK